MSFSRVLAACFRRYPSQTNAVLIGFMAGSLRTVWPWHNGTLPALPPAMDGMVLLAFFTCACGVALPLLVQYIATKKTF